MPSPAANTPLVRVPVLGTRVPIAAAEFGPRNWRVSGFMAWRLVPVHGLMMDPETGRLDLISDGYKV